VGRIISSRSSGADGGRAYADAHSAIPDTAPIACAAPICDAASMRSDAASMGYVAAATHATAAAMHATAAASSAAAGGRVIR